MKTEEFISKYRNHPVLFIGTGISLRYLNNSYTWDSLLRKISYDLKGNKEHYLDIKSKCENKGIYNFSKIATLLEKDFEDVLVKDRDGKFKDVNDIFYEEMEKGVNLSRLKIYVAKILSSLDIRKEMDVEISEFKKVRKNIGSIITTNYDLLIESIFEFEPLVGNDILLSNPYGSVYKIHGCLKQPSKIIITESDYKDFQEKYELIRAQLLSIFIHNPIIFMGYKIGDDNIKGLLKTIFTYVEPNSDKAKKIRENFLLVEYDKDSTSQEICEHDIDMEGFSTIRINKIKTDDFVEIYRCISNLVLPVSAMDIRKVQGIVKEIYSGGKINVNITEDLDSLSNNDKIIAIGSIKTIKYEYHTTSEMMSNYFKIIDESNSQLLELINKHKISTGQYFPVFGFSKIYQKIKNLKILKNQQLEKVKKAFSSVSNNCKTNNSKVEDIISDTNIPPSNKVNAVLWSINQGTISLENVESYLRNYEEKSSTDYRKLLCMYDLKKYGSKKEKNLI